MFGVRKQAVPVKLCPNLSSSGFFRALGVSVRVIVSLDASMSASDRTAPARAL